MAELTSAGCDRVLEGGEQNPAGETWQEENHTQRQPTDAISTVGKAFGETSVG